MSNESTTAALCVCGHVSHKPDELCYAYMKSEDVSPGMEATELCPCNEFRTLAFLDACANTVEQISSFSIPGEPLDPKDDPHGDSHDPEPETILGDLKGAVELCRKTREAHGVRSM